MFTHCFGSGSLSGFLYVIMIGKTCAYMPAAVVYGYITKKYPPAYVFSAVYDSLKEDCRPFGAFLTERGVTAKAKVYGRKCNTEAVRVYHVNIRLPIAERCNRDQIKFFKALVK